MSTVMTVTGPVAPEKLGRVLVHEHVLVTYPGAELDPTDQWDRSACVETAVARMLELKEHGVATFVDAGPGDIGRDPELLVEVAERSGMQIVCATGFYHERIGVPYYWRNRTIEELAELFLHEIEQGVGGTSVRPGVIKIASFDPPGEHDRKVIAGAAIAARESGLPLISHCENSRGGDIQQAILAEHGVDLRRCLIGHQDQETDLENIKALADRGSFVGIDRIGYEILAPEDHRADFIAALIEAGYTDRLCLSQDHMCCLRSARFPYPIPAEVRDFWESVEPMVYEQMFRRTHTYMFTDFFPKLRDRGVDAGTIDRILTDNPRRLLAGE
ncbi:MAG: hypothetical protein WDA71_07790 [Actinomycetota bacterium]